VWRTGFGRGYGCVVRQNYGMMEGITDSHLENQEGDGRRQRIFISLRMVVK
jgi:hypothetical protein